MWDRQIIPHARRFRAGSRISPRLAADYNRTQINLRRDRRMILAVFYLLTWRIQHCAGENERSACEVKKREEQYADLTSRVTFVGRCSSRQIARVHLYFIPIFRSMVHTRTDAAQGGVGAEPVEKILSPGVHCGGSPISHRPLFTLFILSAEQSIKESISVFPFLLLLPPPLGEKYRSRILECLRRRKTEDSRTSRRAIFS